MPYQFLLNEVADHVAIITLNRPDRYNALIPEMREELLDAVHQANRDANVRAVVITGAGKGFCSGGDVKAMQDAAASGTGNPLSNKLAPIRDDIILSMRESAKPYIAAVNGPAAGGGMGIALACDIRIASDNARFSQSFSKRGLHPDWGGTYFLPRLVGVAKACELIWSGRTIDAQEALSLGIVSQLTEPHELMPTALSLAQTFAAGPPVAIRLAKRAIYRGMDSSLREALEYETYAQNICLDTKDVKEGIQAFLEKREPEFIGE